MEPSSRSRFSVEAFVERCAELVVFFTLSAHGLCGGISQSTVTTVGSNYLLSELVVVFCQCVPSAPDQSGSGNISGGIDGYPNARIIGACRAVCAKLGFLSAARFTLSDEFQGQKHRK